MSLITYRTELVSSSAGFDGTDMKKTELGWILVYNNNSHVRTPLTLAQSHNEGRTWEHVLNLESDPTGEFAYPFVLQSQIDPSMLHVCYTFHNTTVHTMAYAQIHF